MDVFNNIEILVVVFAIGTFLVVQFLVTSFVIGKVLVPNVSCISYKWGFFLCICRKIDSKDFLSFFSLSQLVANFILCDKFLIFECHNLWYLVPINEC
jgi:hypothetical protein